VIAQPLRENAQEDWVEGRVTRDAAHHDGHSRLVPQAAYEVWSVGASPRLPSAVAGMNG
jgi:hypothetical protein